MDQPLYITPGYALKSTPSDEFAVWASLYRGADEHYRTEAEFRGMLEGQPTHFLLRQGVVVGGAVIGPGVLAYPFAVPPVEGLGSIITALSSHLRKITPPGRAIAPGIRQSELAHFMRAGWMPVKGEGDGMVWCCAMARPTQKCEWWLPEGFELVGVTKKNIPAVSQLLCAAYDGKDPLRTTPDEFAEDLSYAFSKRDASCSRASSLLLFGKEPVGASIVTLWAGTPVIWDIAIHPLWRGQHLGDAMILKALNALSGTHPLLRLFVAQGNSAQALYHRMGFVARETTCDLEMTIHE